MKAAILFILGGMLLASILGLFYGAMIASFLYI